MPAIVGAVVGLVVVLFMVRAARRRRERSMSADALSDVIGTAGLWHGGTWKVGEQPWL